MKNILIILFTFLSAIGFTQTYEYDHLNRLTSVKYKSGTQVTYMYDQLGNRVSKVVNSDEINLQAKNVSILTPPLSSGVRYYTKDKLKISYQIANTLNRNFDSAYKVSFYISTKSREQFEKNTALFIKTEEKSGLKANEAKTFETVLNLASLPVNSPYYVYAFVDADNELKEVDETDNLSPASEKFIFSKPDFMVENLNLLNAKDTYKVGDQIEISFKLWNIGKGQGLTLLHALYLGQANDVKQDLQIQEFARNLSAGRFESIVYNYTVPASLKTGTYYITVFAEKENSIYERDETNNIKSISISIQNESGADTTPPTVVTQNITVELNAEGKAVVTAEQINNGSSDNVTSPENLVLSIDKTEFTCSDIGEQEVTLTVKDEAGNEKAGKAIVTVLDKLKPELTVRNLVLDLAGRGSVTFVANQAVESVKDNCTPTIKLSASKTEFTATGEYDVVITAEDAQGNKEEKTTKVTVVDNGSGTDTTPPTVVTQNIMVQLTTEGKVRITPEQINDGSSDNVTSPENLVLSIDKTEFRCSDIGEQEVTLTVKDEAGNEKTGKAIVTVVDKLKPSLEVKNATLDLNGKTSISLSISNVVATANDNCSVDIRLSKTEFTAIGEYEVSVTATDGNTENDVVKQVTVTIVDTASSKDDDGDGVPNKDDVCSKEYGFDFAKGCYVQLPNTAVEFIRPTCRGELGQIKLYNSLAYELKYVITRLGNEVKKGVIQPGERKQIDKMQVGIYSVRFFQGSQYEQYFNASVLAPKNVTFRVMDLEDTGYNTGKVLINDLTGTAPFKIYNNGVFVLETNLNTVEIPVVEGENTIEVQSAKSCEGKMIETVEFISSNLTLYPNPVKEILFYNIPPTFEKAELAIVSVNGQVVLKEQTINGQVDVKDFKAGEYIFILENKETNKVLYSKFIKQ